MGLFFCLCVCVCVCVCVRVCVCACLRICIWKWADCRGVYNVGNACQLHFIRVLLQQFLPKVLEVAKGNNKVTRLNTAKDITETVKSLQQFAMIEHHFRRCVGQQRHTHTPHAHTLTVPPTMHAHTHTFGSMSALFLT